MSNKLIVGLADKTEALFTKPGVLLIVDGEIADSFLDRYSRAKLFDPHLHSVKLFPMPYRRAREFASVIYGDEGRTTLTARNGKRALTRLLMNAKRLDELESGDAPDEQEAMAAVNDLLLSPVLSSVFCNVKNFTFHEGNPPSSVVAKLDRAEIGEFDAKVLGSVLISQFPGQIIVPDFGFYARDFHASLIREGRLIAGVHSLAELDEELRQLCLLMEKVALQCTADDAVTLAKYEGLYPDPTREKNPYNTFIEEAIAERPSMPRQARERKRKRVIVRRPAKERKSSTKKRMRAVDW